MSKAIIVGLPIGVAVMVSLGVLGTAHNTTNNPSYGIDTVEFYPDLSGDELNDRVFN
jgi:hypothetical protein